MVSVSTLVVEVVDGLKDAFMPAGRPEAVSCTFPLKPFSPTTATVLLALPPAGTMSELLETLKLTLGCAADVREA